MLEYSKKVKQHFLKPRNVGEIKDADGIGKVGNPTCLLPDERVHKNCESIEISDLQKNHRVLTHNGRYEEIIQTVTRTYNGKIITLKNKLGKVNLTPEHLVYAIKVPEKQKFSRNSGKRELIPSWYHAENLRKGDIVLYPLLKIRKDVKYLDMNIPKPKYDFRSKNIPSKIPVNSDLLRLFGYFLSEGNVQEKPCKNYISFALHINEEDIINDIKYISKKLFNLQVKVKERPDANGAVIYLYNAQLARWFKTLFGNGAEHKKIPDFIMNLPSEKQKYLIFGLWAGDGYVNLNRDGPRAGFVTISYQLAQQLKLLLLRQKIVPSIYIDKARIIKEVNHKKSFRIHVGQRDSLIKICKILHINYKPKSYESVKSWFDNNYLYTPITSRNITDYSGKVNNLEVDNAHSFVSDAFCLHNCGDVMYVYIKVEKNRIKDIKFKTMGCAAAIATSSMITELAKGKTLEQAEKISKEDVAEALEGLPPIKMHCSNLAADALRNAIENYREKHREK